MGEACSTHGGDEECVKNGGGKNPRGRDHFEDLGES
jgi:hypothetical protein